MTWRVNRLLLAATILIAGTSACASKECCDAGASCSSCLDRACSSGTLFRWSGDLCETGGPDRNAPLVTDRPDFTAASSTVGRGVAQLESGYTFFSDDDGTTITQFHSWGEPLLRYGVFRDWLELRLGLLPITETQETAGRTRKSSGLADMYLGMKIGLTPQAGWRPEMALVPQMFVPLGNSLFSADGVLPGVNWIYSWELTERWSLSGSTQFNRIKTPDEESFTVWAQSLAMGYDLTDRWGAYTEWFGLFPHSADQVKPEHFFDGGFTFLISDDLQWDIRAGVGLNDAAADFFCGSGLSWRFR